MLYSIQVNPYSLRVRSLRIRSSALAQLLSFYAFQSTRYWSTPCHYESLLLHFLIIPPSFSSPQMTAGIAVAGAQAASV